MDWTQEADLELEARNARTTHAIYPLLVHRPRSKIPLQHVRRSAGNFIRLMGRVARHFYLNTLRQWMASTMIYSGHELGQQTRQTHNSQKETPVASNHCSGTDFSTAAFRSSPLA